MICDNQSLAVSDIMLTFVPKIKTKYMIQTHLMKLEAPYPVLNIDGTLVRHVATLIEVRETLDSKTGEEHIKTVSHPVVDYGENAYSGVVFYDKEIEDCQVISREMLPVDFYLLTADAIERHGRKSPMCRPDFLVSRLKNLGVTIQWPVKKDDEGFETDEPEDRFEVKISIGKSEKVGWWVESGDNFFEFGGNGYQSEQDVLTYIRDTRSSYYRAFPERQFDIMFFSKMPEAQPLIKELNDNPHL